MNPTKYYVTDDTAFAAYLLLCGYQFLDGTLWSETDRRKKYVIIDDGNRPNVEEDFYLRRSLVAPLDYHDARVRVSRYLKRNISMKDLK